MHKWLSRISGFFSDDLTQREIRFILDNAKIPEHIPTLIRSISKGKLIFEEGFLGCYQDSWLIFIGYPVSGEFSVNRLEAGLDWVLAKYPANTLWLIAPECPAKLSAIANLMQADQYFELDLAGYQPAPELRRIIKKTDLSIRVDFNRNYSDRHQELIDEFLNLHELPLLVAALYQNLAEIMENLPSLFLLDAWDHRGNLSAFYAVDQAAKNFDTYLIGCYSRANYVPHASDRLFWEMIELARRGGKSSIQLGLGVNPGIRKFKEKWGGRPFLDYYAWQIDFGSTGRQGLISWISEGKW